MIKRLVADATRPVLNRLAGSPCEARENVPHKAADIRWYRVAWFWTGEDQPPQADVFLEVTAGQLTEITTTPPAKFTDLGNRLLIPALVNAHCHLEFSHLAEPLTPLAPFSSWIGQTVQARRANATPALSIQQGLAESRQHGVGWIGEVVTNDTPLPYDSAGVELVLFREMLAFERTQANQQLQQLREFLENENLSARKGISPHAPYTVCPQYLTECVQLSREFDCPVMLHLAETVAELELLKTGRGELVEMLQRLNLWRPEHYPAGLTPLDYLREISLAPRGIIAHGNYLSAEELSFLERNPQLAVVYCPRTHAAFQHAPHPWQEMRNRGINVALGTDGRGSNPDLNLWAEACFLAETFPQSDPLVLLKLATTAGGEALGVDVTLRPGQPATGTLISWQKSSSGQPFLLSKLFSRETIPESVRL